MLPERKYFEKKDCFTQDLNLGQQKLLFFIYGPTIRPSRQDMERLYDLGCVDDQHSHGKSVGKYHMDN